MKRILSAAALAVALALVSGSYAVAKLHASKSRVAAAPAAASVCADPSHCPLGSCPVGSKQAAATAVASTPATHKDAACSNPASCTASCPRGSASTTAAVATKQ